jgi:hypothetical protein
MTNVLHRRKLTWALVLWSGYIGTWAVITDSGPAIVTLWWLAGTIFFGVLWLGTQPLFKRGRGRPGLVVRAGWTTRRLRSHRVSEGRRNAR